MELISATRISQYTIAIVEDEPVLREELAFQLRHHGFAVETFEGATPFYRYLAMHPQTIAVLDIGLDGEDGLSIARYLRSHNRQMGVVFLTARSLHDDRMHGLALGADAYLTKPVELNELVLVLQRQIERMQTLTPPTQPSPSPAAGSSAWQLLTEGVVLVAPNSVRVSLSITEAQVFRYLLANEDRICSHVELCTALRMLPEEFDKHRIEVIVSRLRAKVQRQTGLSLPLQSLRGQGYRFSPAEQP